MPFYTESLTADVVDGSGGFLYSHGTEVEKSVEKEHKSIEKTVKTDPGGSDYFLRCTDSRLNHPAPSS